MFRDFNLLATTSRGNEHDTCSELQYLLSELGDSSPQISRSRISGIVLAKTNVDLMQVIEGLRRLLTERPYEFRYTLRIMPIQSVIKTNLEEIKTKATELAADISEGETFRITLEKRFTSLPSREIIDTVAKDIKRKVNLTKPDKVLLIEVIGGLTGLSVIRPECILSVLKMKML